MESTDISFTTYLNDASLPNTTTVRSIYKKLDKELAECQIKSPVKKSISKIVYDYETLQTKYQIIENKLTNVQEVLNGRQERKAVKKTRSKREVVNGKVGLSYSEIAEELAEAEKQTEQRKAPKGKRGRPPKQKPAGDTDIIEED